MTMKFSCAAIVAALLVGVPLVSGAAPDAKKESKKAKTQEGKPAKAQKDAPAKEQEAKPAKEKNAKPAKEKEAKPAKVPEPPAREKPDEAAVAKALKAKKPMYTKFAEAKEAAWNCQQPLLVALLVGNDEKSKQLEAKALRRKEFAKDFVSANCVLLVWRLKPGKPEVPQTQGRGRRRGPPPKPTTIESRSLKQPEVDFLSKFAVSAQAIANAKRRGDHEPKYTAIANYPTVVCIDSECKKLYFRDPKYDASAGSPAASFGVWFSQVVDWFRKTGQEPVLTPALQKIVDNPTEPKKWK